ncbi:MAG: proline racemase family protein [Hyphomicrobiaceae bacterium]
MRFQRLVSMVEAHCEGEVGRVVTGGLPTIPGDSPAEMLRYLNEVDDSVRRFLVFEPRGAAQMSTNILVPRTHPEADAAFIILQADRAHAMSGSNSICVVTVLTETGLVEMKEPDTVVTLETPAGLVKATASCRDGKCERVRLDMTPAFVEALDLAVDVPDLGAVQVDIAYGGCFYALVDVRQFGLRIARENARRLVDIAMRTQQVLNRTREIVHPEIPAIRGISYTMLTDWSDDGHPVGATVLPPGRIDRSPCGTGNAARMAIRSARGEVRRGARVEARSIIGSTFQVELVGETTVAGRPAVLTQVSGRGWIHGLHQIGVDPSDPFPKGFMLTDTWGEALDLILEPGARSP